MDNIKLPKVKQKILTGIPEFDQACGGLQRGRFIEIFGPAGVGKTLLILKLIAELQQREYSVLYVDVDQTFDTIHAIKLGVNLKTLSYARIQSGILDGLIEAGLKYDVIIIDPIVALDAPEIIVDFFYKNLNQITKAHAAFILINQIRSDIQTGKQISPLGRTFHHFMSMQVKLTAKKFLKAKGRIVGYQLYGEILKNKLAPKVGVVAITIPYEGGV